MVFKKKPRKPPVKTRYTCRSCGQKVTQTVGWTSCPHCNKIGQLVRDTTVEEKA